MEDTSRNRARVRSLINHMSMLADELSDEGLTGILPEDERRRLRAVSTNIRNSRENLIPWWDRRYR